jgi:hypothetical protein
MNQSVLDVHSCHQPARTLQTVAPLPADMFYARWDHSPPQLQARRELTAALSLPSWSADQVRINRKRSTRPKLASLASHRQRLCHSNAAAGKLISCWWRR